MPGPVAYFSMEFGIHESLGIYSGGLGVLAGDHCKRRATSASPRRVGLLYRSGYFRQTVDADGFQQHTYPTTTSPGCRCSRSRPRPAAS